MTWLIFIVSASVGAVLWSAFLRLPSALARWLCSPFGQPGSFGMVVSLAISIFFLAIVLCAILMGLAYFFEMQAIADFSSRKIRGFVFISSLGGYALIPVVIRLEHIFRG
ncbi:hypothetical protein [Xanthomonas sp. MUS 060]|uniref:hypothetical protein n=1 Tax=Xanthomonas sp. MUS 060 TaxID=1588031 RepID=UPI00126A228B|nr:hypothetical protein [Xanthomonas sp. MUS 060]